VPSAPSSGSLERPIRLQVSTKSPHHGFLPGSPKLRPSRFSQSISQLRSRASFRPSAVLPSVIHGKRPCGANAAARPFGAIRCLRARAVRTSHWPSMVPGAWPSLSNPL